MPRSNFFRKNGVFIPKIGSNLTDVIDEAIQLATREKHEISFELQDITVNVTSDSEPTLILRDLQRALNGYTEKTVGPTPNPILSKREQENDARIGEKNRKQREQEVDKLRQVRQLVEARIKDAPTMKLSNVSIWSAANAAHNNGIYNTDILSYAERWTRMMQLELHEGKTLQEIWERTSYEADFENISGPSQTAATHLLIQCWIHGKELQRLYNQK